MSEGWKCLKALQQTKQYKKAQISREIKSVSFPLK